MGTWLNTSRRKTTCHSDSVSTTRSPNTPQHPPIACILLLFLSVNVLFLTLCVLFRPFPVHLTCRPPYQSNHSCRLLWVHSRSAGSSPPASGWVLGNGYLKARYFILKVYLLSCKKNLFTPWQQLINQILWKLRGKRSSIAKANNGRESVAYVSQY